VSDKPIKTPIDASVIARVITGVRYALSGVTPNGWLSPGQPIQPVAQQEAKGRAFDFAPNVNIKQNPRSEEAVTAAQLRALADGYDLLRLVIETRKDQMSRLAFSIRPRDEDADPDDRCKQVEDFLRFPDREHPWQDWLRMVLEDLFVLDAATIYPRMTNGGTLYALETIDGATVRRIIDATGRTPVAPDPAYQQLIRGLPAVNYSRDELIYRPRNLRTHKIYGFGPVEQIITTVNIAVRRQLYQLQYFTEGSVPDLIMQVPAEWNPSQIKEFSAWWQSMLAGNTAERARAMFVPSGVTPVDTKEKALHDQFDDWLARIVCYAFSVSPQGFVKDQNRATANTAKAIAAEEGLLPIMQWVKGVIDTVIWRYFGFMDLEFEWDQEEDHDPIQQAQINKIYLDAKVVTPDEIRAGLGMDPLTDEQKAELAPPPPPMAVGPDGKPVPGAEQGAAVGAKRVDGANNDPTPPKGEDAAQKAQKKSPYTRARLTANDSLSA
jgi:hypothetical protein